MHYTQAEADNPSNPRQPRYEFKEDGKLFGSGADMSIIWTASGGKINLYSQGILAISQGYTINGTKLSIIGSSGVLVAGDYFKKAAQ
jgi:hypothetical protein